jgi:hypothetical protein
MFTSKYVVRKLFFLEDKCFWNDSYLSIESLYGTHVRRVGSSWWGRVAVWPAGGSTEPSTSLPQSLTRTCSGVFCALVIT